MKDKRILVVDDDSVILNTVTVMLRNFGMIPTVADSGREALGILSQETPDILLLDYMMPGMSGAEVYKLLQNESSYESCRDVPVIMLTAKTDNEAEQIELLKMGLSAYLLKPFGYKELVNIISNVLTLHEAKMENLRLNRQVTDMKNYLQSVFDGITDFISVQDSEFNIRNYNQAANISFFGAQGTSRSFENTEMDGKCYAVYFKRDTVCPQCPAVTGLLTGQPNSGEIRSETGYFQVSIFPIQNSGSGDRAFIEVIKDITERKELEQQLIESLKLASVGTLAAGVAHEINNPLSIVLGFAQTMLKEISSGDRLHKDLKIVEQEATRCTKVVKDLLSFARPGRMEKTETNLIELIQTSIGLMRHFIRKNEIVLTEHYSAEVPKCWVDAKKMQQVFVNVLMNAADAMPRGGHLRVSIWNDPNDDKVVIEIADTGYGIDESDLAKIFDPFYSTKANKGTGLGLSISKSIVKEHLGSIDVRSKKNEGTVVTIRLPGNTTKA